MKKALLGTSALIAAAMIASPAAAQLELSTSASYYWEVGFTDNDSTGGGDDWDFQNEGWVQFNARGTSDNGLTYGFRLDIDDIETDAPAAVDETYVFFQGSFGTVTLGDDDHAADDVRVGVPTSGTGLFDGGFGDYAPAGIAGVRQDLVRIGPFGNDDDTKIKYTSTGADLAGFTVGVSYSPDSGSGGDNLDRVNGTPAGDFENVFSAGVRYEGDFQGFSVLVGAAGYLGDNVAPAPGADNDLESWTVGLNVGSGGFDAGINYVSGETLGNPSGGVAGTNVEVSGFNVGVTYGQGPWEIGASFSDFEDDDNNNEEQVYGIGGSYDWLPGVGIDADIMSFDGTGQTDGWVALLRVGISA